jgi:NAD(P)-dependent dehydrogenase (short-subunit alcohol dehydrogenase family)
MAAHRWTAADIPDQSGRIAVVTGGRSGVGRHVADALAAHGATVVVASRDPGRGVRLDTGHPVLVAPAQAAGDAAAARRLWELSAALTGVTYRFTGAAGA